MVVLVTVAPVQVVVGFGPTGMVTPAGMVSVRLTPEAGCPAGLKKVMRKRERWLGSITLGVNCLVRPILPCVVRLVVAKEPLLRPSDVAMAPTGMKLVMPPVVVIVDRLGDAG